MFVCDRSNTKLYLSNSLMCGFRATSFLSIFSSLPLNMAAFSIMILTSPNSVSNAAPSDAPPISGNAMVSSSYPEKNLLTRMFQ